MFNSFNVCDIIKVHDIIKVEKEEKDTSKEELKTNDSNLSDTS